jgi:hypothetical protein
MKRKKKSIQDPTARELDAVKRLLILLLMKSGASQREIAKTLGMDQGNFNRAYPIGRVKRFGEE